MKDFSSSLLAVGAVCTLFTSPLSSFDLSCNINAITTSGGWKETCQHPNIPPISYVDNSFHPAALDRATLRTCILQASCAKGDKHGKPHYEHNFRNASIIYSASNGCECQTLINDNGNLKCTQWSGGQNCDVLNESGILKEEF
jgi:hypothetical protein